MSIDNENEILDTTTDVSESHPEPIVEKVEPRFRKEPESKKSVRALIEEGMNKSKQEGDEPLPMTSKERKAKETVEPKAPVSSAKKESTAASSKEDSVADISSKESKSEETIPPTPPQATGIPAPAALTKEEKELWANTPKEIQEAFFRRESDTQKGIDNLKAKYKPIEDALAPIRPLLQQRGLTEAHAVKQLFDWHAALSSPHKASQINAFKALAQSHGVDINLLTPPPVQQPVAQPQPSNQSADPFAQIQPYLEQAISPIAQKLNAYEAQLHNQRLESANKELATFSADKPHFEKVRVRMAEILSTASQFGRPIGLQEAYDEAVWGMPELRSEIMQEQEAKRQAEFEAQQADLQKKYQEEYLAKAKLAEEEAAKKRELEAAEKARRASVSPRSTSPVGPIIANKGARKPQSVADTLRDSIKGLSATI